MKSPTLESGPNICKMTRVLLESGKLLLFYLLAKWSLPSISLELSVLDQRSFSISTLVAQLVQLILKNWKDLRGSVSVVLRSNGEAKQAFSKTF